MRDRDVLRGWHVEVVRVVSEFVESYGLSF